MPIRCMLRIGGAAVPIYRLLQNEAFLPEDITLLSGVFEDVLNALGLTNRADPLTELVARKIIELAQTGERDWHRLKQLTVETFEGRRA